MIDEATLAHMNAKYLMPPDASPAWRAAAEYGFDMSLVEEAWQMTPERRLEQHQLALDTVLELREAGEHHAAKEPGAVVRAQIKEKREPQKELF